MSFTLIIILLHQFLVLIILILIIVVIVVFIITVIMLCDSVVVSLKGKFSTKSDVWSFGVTMWEILTFALEQPLHNLTNEQVIANLDHFYSADGQALCPPRPALCPPEIYDLIRECWNRDEAARPSFREIHMFLHRKNMGYSTRSCAEDTKTNDATTSAAAAAAAAASNSVVV